MILTSAFLKPKYRLRDPEKYLIILSKKVFCQDQSMKKQVLFNFENRSTDSHRHMRNNRQVLYILNTHRWGRTGSGFYLTTIQPINTQTETRFSGVADQQLLDNRIQNDDVPVRTAAMRSPRHCRIK